MELLTGGSKLLPWNLGEKLYIQAAVCVYHNLYHRSFEASIIITYNNENIDILNQKKKKNKERQVERRTWDDLRRDFPFWRNTSYLHQPCPSLKFHHQIPTPWVWQPWRLSANTSVALFQWSILETRARSWVEGGGGRATEKESKIRDENGSTSFAVLPNSKPWWGWRSEH